MNENKEDDVEKLLLCRAWNTKARVGLISINDNLAVYDTDASFNKDPDLREKVVDVPSAKTFTIPLPSDVGCEHMKIPQLSWSKPNNDLDVYDDTENEDIAPSRLYASLNRYNSNTKKHDWLAMLVYNALVVWCGDNNDKGDSSQSTTVHEVIEDAVKVEWLFQNSDAFPSLAYSHRQAQAKQGPAGLSMVSISKVMGVVYPDRIDLLAVSAPAPSSTGADANADEEGQQGGKIENLHSFSPRFSYCSTLSALSSFTNSAENENDNGNGNIIKVQDLCISSKGKGKLLCEDFVALTSENVLLVMALHLVGSKSRSTPHFACILDVGEVMKPSVVLSEEEVEECNAAVEQEIAIKREGDSSSNSGNNANENENAENKEKHLLFEQRQELALRNKEEKKKEHVLFYLPASVDGIDVRGALQLRDENVQPSDLVEVEVEADRTEKGEKEETVEKVDMSEGEGGTTFSSSSSSSSSSSCSPYPGGLSLLHLLSEESERQQSSHMVCSHPGHGHSGSSNMNMPEVEIHASFPEGGMNASSYSTAIDKATRGVSGSKEEDQTNSTCVAELFKPFLRRTRTAVTAAFNLPALRKVTLPIDWDGGHSSNSANTGSGQISTTTEIHIRQFESAIVPLIEHSAATLVRAKALAIAFGTPGISEAETRISNANANANANIDTGDTTDTGEINGLLKEMLLATSIMQDTGKMVHETLQATNELQVYKVCKEDQDRDHDQDQGEGSYQSQHRNRQDKDKDTYDVYGESKGNGQSNGKGEGKGKEIDTCTSKGREAGGGSAKVQKLLSRGKSIFGRMSFSNNFVAVYCIPVPQQPLESLETTESTSSPTSIAVAAASAESFKSFKTKKAKAGGEKGASTRPTVQIFALDWTNSSSSYNSSSAVNRERSRIIDSAENLHLRSAPLEVLLQKRNSSTVSGMLMHRLWQIERKYEHCESEIQENTAFAETKADALRLRQQCYYDSFLSSAAKTSKDDDSENEEDTKIMNELNLLGVIESLKNRSLALKAYTRDMCIKYDVEESAYDEDDSCFDSSESDYTYTDDGRDMSDVEICSDRDRDRQGDMSDMNSNTSSQAQAANMYGGEQGDYDDYTTDMSNMSINMNNQNNQNQNQNHVNLPMSGMKIHHPVMANNRTNSNDNNNGNNNNGNNKSKSKILRQAEQKYHDRQMTSNMMEKDSSTKSKSTSTSSSIMIGRSKSSKLTPMNLSISASSAPNSPHSPRSTLGMTGISGINSNRDYMDNYMDNYMDRDRDRQGQRISISEVKAEIGNRNTDTISNSVGSRSYKPYVPDAETLRRAKGFRSHANSCFSNLAAKAINLSEPLISHSSTTSTSTGSALSVSLSVSGSVCATPAGTETETGRIIDGLGFAGFAGLNGNSNSTSTSVGVGMGLGLGKSNVCVPATPGRTRRTSLVGQRPVWMKKSSSSLALKPSDFIMERPQTPDPLLGPPEPLISEAEKIVLEASERVRIIEEQEERIKKDKKDKKDKDAKVEEEKRAMAAAAEALELERNPPLGM